MGTAIQFHGKTASLKTLNRQNIKSVIHTLAGQHKKSVHSLDYILVSEKRILEINQQFLGHDYYTDIITFDYTERKSSALKGEVYISPATVSSNAVLYNSSTSEEMLRVIFHGLLHLLGYKDKTGAQQKQMRAMEAHCLTLYRDLAG